MNDYDQPVVIAGTGTGAGAGAGQAARPQLIRAMNEQLLLSQIRQLGICSRADLARLSGLSKPTVSLALANVERSGLVRIAGQRTGVPGRSAVLYEIRPEAGYVLGLDIGHEYLRGAIADLTGEVRAKAEARSPAGSVSKRVGELIRLADGICKAAGVSRADVTQTVLGSPGVYDPSRDVIALAGGLAGWDKRAVLARLREAFGPNFVVENDTDAAALAEREHGHGREFASFAFVSIGSGIGMGLVLDGQLHRGAHGVAGEIAFLPITEGPAGFPGAGSAGAGSAGAGSAGVAGAGRVGSGGVAGVGPAGVVGAGRAGSAGGTGRGGPAVPVGPPDQEVRRRGALEAAGSSSAIVRSARQAGLRATSARQVFAAAAAGDDRAVMVVATEARLVAKAICAIITVIDPGLVVLGGGIGQAPGFAAAVSAELAKIAPVMPEIRVSALGTSAVVDGCLASGADMAWGRLTAQLAQAQPEADAGVTPLPAASR